MDDDGALQTRLVETFRWVYQGDARSGLADCTGWLRDRTVAQRIGIALAELSGARAADVVLAPETSGLALGALTTQAAGIGLVGAWKRRRDLADDDRWVSASSGIDYRNRNQEFFVRRSLLEGATAVIVDDWADTGGTLSALKCLADRAGARVLGVVTVVDAMDSNERRRALELRALLHQRELRER